GFNNDVDCSAGGAAHPGDPTFLNGNLGIDMISAAAWVQTAAKQGWVCFGQLIDVIPGFNYGSDFVPHAWYGPQLCWHGQDGRPLWNGKGTGTSTQVPYVSIYDPSTLAASAQGLVSPWSFEASTVRPLATVSPLLPTRAESWYMFGGAHFDSTD